MSVTDDGAGLDTPTEDAAVDAFNDGLQALGQGVFAARVARPSHRHRQPV